MSAYNYFHDVPCCVCGAPVNTKYRGMLFFCSKCAGTESAKKAIEDHRAQERRKEIEKLRAELCPGCTRWKRDPANPCNSADTQ